MYYKNIDQNIMTIKQNFTLVYVVVSIWLKYRA